MPLRTERLGATEKEPLALEIARSTAVLREVSGERQAIEANLKAGAAQCVPNYIGVQRFGFDGGNLEPGRAMLAREIRVRNLNKQGLDLSALRSSSSTRCSSSRGSGAKPCPATRWTNRAGPPDRCGAAAA